MNSWYYFVYIGLLFALAMFYFKVAQRYRIIDLPNHRTMHEDATIRGGGIIIFFGVLAFSLFMGTPGLYFVTGLLIIGITGLMDDIINLSSNLRFPLQVISIFMILVELDLLSGSLWIILLLIIIATGILNAYNFMDGINGITGGYSLIAVITMVYINNYTYQFTENSFLVTIILSLLVFNFFNFRTKAICFAGDVGSLSIAFIIIYLLLKLIVETQQLIYILFLTVYGIDTIFTLIQRAAKKENIFKAHRQHLFQVLVSKLQVPHLYITVLYVVIQSMINFVVIAAAPINGQKQILYMGILLSVLTLIYFVVKGKMMRSSS